MVTEIIPQTFNYFHQTYEQITEEKLSDREDALKQLVYDTSKPVDNVFNKIIVHQDLGILV